MGSNPAPAATQGSWASPSCSCCDKVCFTLREWLTNELICASVRFFLDAALLICLYHTLRTFRREVTCDKIGITSSQREECLTILQALAYAADEEAYQRHMDQLVALGYEKVIKYVKDSWEPIRDEWVEGLKAKKLTFGERTNNRLESINAKIKSVCTKHACLQRFFIDFLCFLSSMRLERRHRALMTFTKKRTTDVPAELVPYLELLTRFAFKFVKAQYKKSLTAEVPARCGDDFIFKVSGSTVRTTAASCDCRAYSSRRLPCQHVLYNRRLLALPFDETVVDIRGTRANYMAHYRSLELEGPSFNAAIRRVEETSHVTGRRTLSHVGKYKKSRRLTDSLACLCSEPGMTIFKQRCEILQQLYDSWSKGVEVLSLNTDPTPAVVSASSTSAEVSLTLPEVSNADDFAAFQGESTEVLLTLPEVSDAEDFAALQGESAEVLLTLPEVSTADAFAALQDEFAEVSLTLPEVSTADAFAALQDEFAEVSLTLPEVSTADAFAALQGESAEVSLTLLEVSDADAFAALQDQLASIRMPARMRKRGRPKGTETTVIGIPRKRQRKGCSSSDSQPSALMDGNCAKCLRTEPPKGRKGKQQISWIQCDSCEKWYHRSCCTAKTLPKGKRSGFKCQMCCTLGI